MSAHSSRSSLVRPKVTVSQVLFNPNFSLLIQKVFDGVEIRAHTSPFFSGDILFPYIVNVPGTIEPGWDFQNLNRWSSNTVL